MEENNISTVSKQMLFAMYQKELYQPAKLFYALKIDSKIVSDPKNENKDLIDDMLRIAGGNSLRVLQSVNYLLESGYLTAGDVKASPFGDYAMFCGLRMSSKGVDFVEDVASGDKEKMKQVGLVVNGDMNFSLELDSIVKAEASDLLGIKKIAEFFTNKNN
jgi:hypothetical protein|nr:MAG TPA: hypothetical protein [Caudoviricetes sp.]